MGYCEIPEMLSPSFLDSDISQYAYISEFCDLSIHEKVKGADYKLAGIEKQADHCLCTSSFSLTVPRTGGDLPVAWHEQE